MKKIKLTQDKYAIVDDEDFEWLNQWKWGALRKRKSNLYYAYRMIYANGKQKGALMHRLVNNTPKGSITDHINRDGLDNRRSNLRTVTRIQSMINRGVFKNNISGYRGVSWDKQTNSWMTQIQFNNKQTNLGRYINKADAARAYNKAATQFFGEFAVLNIIVKEDL